MISLHALDNDFFEEYKRLEQLCSDIYSHQNGVSEYLSDMESNAYQGQFKISCWTADYKMLKRVRWVRNQIAHNSGAYHSSTLADLAFVQDFHSRIISGQDPLSLLRRTSAARLTTPPKKQPQANSPQPLSPVQSRKNSRVFIVALISLGIIMLIIFLIAKLFV